MHLRRLVPLLENLHHHGGRGEGEPHAGDDRDGRRQPDEHGAAGEQRAAGQDLRQSKTENILLQRPQPRRLQLQPDDEEEHDDAELGDADDRRRPGEDRQAERPDDDAGGQVADDRADADPLEDRHRHHPRGKQRHRGQEINSVGFDFHVPPPSMKREQIGLEKGAVEGSRPPTETISSVGLQIRGDPTWRRQRSSRKERQRTGATAWRKPSS